MGDGKINNVAIIVNDGSTKQNIKRMEQSIKNLRRQGFITYVASAKKPRVLPDMYVSDSKSAGHMLQSLGSIVDDDDNVEIRVIGLNDTAGRGKGQFVTDNVLRQLSRVCYRRFVSIETSTLVDVVCRKLKTQKRNVKVDVQTAVRADLKIMDKARLIAQKMYREAKRRKDIIRTACWHEKLVTIKNYISLAREAFSVYLMAKGTKKEKIVSDAWLRQKVADIRARIDNVVCKTARCEVVTIDKPTSTEEYLKP